MKKTVSILLALCLIVCLMAGCGSSSAPAPAQAPAAQAPAAEAPAAEARTFIMGIDAEYPPFSYMDDQGNYTGFDVEICRFSP